MNIDLFISAAEPSGDLHGAKLIEALLEQRPSLKIGASAGPRMRLSNIEPLFQMEDLSVMGFIDVLWAGPKIIRQFFKMRKKILELNPKAVVFIDYPGFHLRLEKSLRKKGFKGKLIHFICPTVWAWGKKRIEIMEQNLDLLLTIFPFEPKCFSHTRLPVQYIGHPLVNPIRAFTPKGTFQGKILGLFPGSRQKEIERNLPLQLGVARQLKKLDPELQIAISAALPIPIDAPDALIVPEGETYELMKASFLAIATSGTVTLELALHGTPTVVTFAIRPLDCFLAQKIFRINLPFYCIVNIIAGKLVFPELFGPNFTGENLFSWARKLWFEEAPRTELLKECEALRKSLGVKQATREGAKAVLSIVDF